MSSSSSNSFVFSRADGTNVLDNLSIITYSKATSGVRSNLNIYAKGSGILTESLSVFSPAGLGSGLDNINVFSYGEAFHDDDSLFIYSSNSGISSSLKIYSSGRGTNPGWLFQEDYLNIFTKRPEYESLFIYSNCPNSYENSLNVYSNGVFRGSGSLSILTSGKGQLSESLRIFGRGF